MLLGLCCPCFVTRSAKAAKIHIIEPASQSPTQPQAQAHSGSVSSVYEVRRDAKDNQLNPQDLSRKGGMQSAFAGIKHAATDFFHRAGVDFGPSQKHSSTMSMSARRVLLQFKIELLTELSAHELLYFPGMIHLLESCLARTCRVSTDEVCLCGITDKLFPKSIFLDDGRIAIEYAVVIECKVFVEVQASHTDEARRIAQNLVQHARFSEDVTYAMHRANVGELEHARFTAQSIAISLAVVAPLPYGESIGIAAAPADDDDDCNAEDYKIHKTYEYVSNHREVHSIPFCDDIPSDGEEEEALAQEAIADLRYLENEDEDEVGVSLRPSHNEDGSSINGGPTADEVKWAENVLEEDAKYQYRSLYGGHRTSTFGFGTLIKSLVQASREQQEENAATSSGHEEEVAAGTATATAPVELQVDVKGGDETALDMRDDDAAAVGSSKTPTV